MVIILKNWKARSNLALRRRFRQFDIHIIKSRPLLRNFHITKMMMFMRDLKFSFSPLSFTTKATFGLIWDY